MKRFRVFDYIKQYQIPIIVLSLLAGVIFYGYMQTKQTYTASAVISYTNSQAAEGLAPDGSKIDVSEIYSSQAMTRVFEQLGLDYSEYNLDELRSRVTVTGIVTEEDKAVQEAVNATGEQSTAQPTRYYVSFKALRSDSDNPETFARQILDNLLNVYIENYGEKHINSLMAPNDISGLDERDYDYLEMAEILDDSIEKAVVAISKSVNEDNTFRAAANGYSFMDLYREFTHLKEVELSNVYAYILNNKVTKDRDALIAKYENRIENYGLNNNASQTKLDAIDRVINSYVEMMRESGNTDITYDYILDDVYDDWEEEQKPDQTVEYDVLMTDYVDDREDFEWTLIEVAYCEYILDIFRGDANLGTGLDLDGIETVNEDRVAEEGTDADSKEEAAEEKPETVPIITGVYAETSQEALDTTAAMISELVEKTNHLYEILMVVNQEFNAFCGATNINLLSNIVVIANQKILLYAALVVVIFLCVFCVAAIILGRLGDVVDYYVYRDRKFDLPNRIGCDKFMEAYANRMLPDDFGCIVLRLIRIQEKNSLYGREAMDQMMLKFNSIIKEIFPKNDDCFIALNGVGQYIIYSRNMSKEHMDAYAEYLRNEAESYNATVNCKIEYECGMAESRTYSIYRIKLLLVNALHNIKPVIREAG